MTLPPPEPGGVIRYSYLWADEHEQGREEGREDRPCVIVVATRRDGDKTLVTVVPVTRSPQSRDAIELPPEVKARLGLDPSERSWVVCSEYNRFDWPGPDLRPLPRKGDWRYGKLPDGLLSQVVRALLAARRHLRVVVRTP